MLDVHDHLGEMLLATTMGNAPKPEAYSFLRLKLAELHSRMEQRGLEAGAGLEALTRLVGRPEESEETGEVDVPERPG